MLQTNIESVKKKIKRSEVMAEIAVVGAGMMGTALC
jgi:hypothetical protein